ncbi:hypothetical protein R1sor_020764 [Riccia sorocarpa]|uniref:Uncharacterized protein n=1 Tax=Riccia sorocarpa TaxID=122646 RepID=A0ABD3GF60_9MARC
MESVLESPAFDKKFDIKPDPYPSVPGAEECKRVELQRNMEKYGRRQDVYNMLFRYLNDLLTTQPEDPLEFMVKWATKEAKNPDRVKPPVEIDRSCDKYNLQVDLKKKDIQKGKGVAAKSKH